MKTRTLQNKHKNSRDKPKFWNITKIRAENSEGSAGRIDIYGIIDDTEFWGDEITPQSFIDELTALGDVEYLDLHMFTPGGSVYAGMAIHSLIKQYSKPVNCYVEGIVASIGTVIMCACDNVYIADTADTFYHNPYASFFLTSFNSKEARKLADELDRAREPIILAYAKRSGKSRDEILELMDGNDGHGSWLNADECIEFGFADDYIPDGKKPIEAAACIGPNKYNFKGHIIDISQYAAYRKADIFNKAGRSNSMLGFKKKPKSFVGKQHARNEVSLTEIVCWSCGGTMYLNETTGEMSSGPAAGEDGGGDAASDKMQAFKKTGKARNEIFLLECPHCGEQNIYDNSQQSDGDEGEPLIDTSEDEPNSGADGEPEALIETATCPECGAEFEYDTETATETDGGYELTCPECGAVFVEPVSGESGDAATADMLKAAYRRGVRAERDRVKQLVDIAGNAPGMTTAIHAAIKNGNKPNAVRKRVIKGMGSNARQNTQGSRYLATSRRDAQAVNSIGRAVPYAAYKNTQKQETLEQRIFDEELAKAQGRSVNGDDRITKAIASLAEAFEGRSVK